MVQRADLVGIDELARRLAYRRRARRHPSNPREAAHDIDEFFGALVAQFVRSMVLVATKLRAVLGFGSW